MTESVNAGLKAIHVSGGKGLIVSTSFSCNGSESSLMDCQGSLISEQSLLHDCHHNDDVGVQCLVPGNSGKLCNYYSIITSSENSILTMSKLQRNLTLAWKALYGILKLLLHVCIP